MEMQEIKDFLIDEINRRQGIRLNKEYDVPLLNYRNIFKAYDLVSLLCVACEKFGVKLESLGEYDQPVTINGLCQYISKHCKQGET